MIKLAAVRAVFNTAAAALYRPVLSLPVLGIAPAVVLVPVRLSISTPAPESTCTGRSTLSSLISLPPPLHSQLANKQLAMLLHSFLLKVPAVVVFFVTPWCNIPQTMLYPFSSQQFAITPSFPALRLPSLFSHTPLLSHIYFIFLDLYYIFPG